MKPVSWPLIDTEMAFWLDQANSIVPRSPTFPEQIAKVHRDFEAIPPFLDGNGRTGRLVLNLILVRMGYPPAIIYKNEDRRKYLRALQLADNGDGGALGEFVARAILDNLYKFVVPAVAGPARLVPLAALATKELNSTTLRAAAIAALSKPQRAPMGNGVAAACGWTSTPKTDTSAEDEARRYDAAWASLPSRSLSVSSRRCSFGRRSSVQPGHQPVDRLRR